MHVDWSEIVEYRHPFRERRSLLEDQSELLRVAFGELEILRIHFGGDPILCQRLAGLERVLEKMELLNRAALTSSRGLPRELELGGADL